MARGRARGVDLDGIQLLGSAQDTDEDAAEVSGGGQEEESADGGGCDFAARNANHRQRVQSVKMPDTEPTRLQTVSRWVAIVLSGPLLVFALIQVDWSFLPKSSGALELSAEFLVGELVISFKLTLLAIVSLAVFRVLCSQNRQTRNVAVLLPLYLWGLEATALDRTILFSSSWTPHFLMFLLWLVPVVTFSALALVLLSGMLHSCVGESDASGRRARRIAQIGLRPAISAGVVVTTVLLDLLLLSVVMGESIASEIPS